MKMDSNLFETIRFLTTERRISLNEAAQETGKINFSIYIWGNAERSQDRSGTLIRTLYFGNVGTQMNRNAIEILKKQVENRQNYLQSTLEESQNLSSLAGTINTAVENQTAVENISVEELVNNEDRSTELLETVSDSLINTMRHRAVNGIL